MSKLMCYVGLNPVGGSATANGIAQTEKPRGGGIAVFEVDADGRSLDYKGCVPKPAKAGALNYARETGILYAVDESKTPGRGDQEKGSAVYAFKVDQATGALTELNHVPSMGPNPTDILAIPSIAADYSSGAVLISWIVTSYLLASAAFLLPFGRLADIMGRKRLYIAGIFLLGLSTLACVFAPTANILIILFSCLIIKLKSL